MQFALMQSTPSIIAIGVIKRTFGSKFHETFIDNFMSEDFYWKVQKFIKETNSIENSQFGGMLNLMQNRR